MVTLREDKKREILDFLQQNADDDRMMSLELEAVTTKFSDDDFDEEAIEDIIDELEDEDLVVTNKARIELVYPANRADVIEERFSHLFSRTSTLGSFVIGVALYLLLLEWDPFFDFVVSDGLSQIQAASRYALFGIVLSYLLGRVAIEGYQEAQSRISVLREYRALIYPSVAIGVVCGGVVLAFVAQTGQTLKPEHLIGIITVSILGGIPVGKLFVEGPD